MSPMIPIITTAKKMDIEMPVIKPTDDDLPFVSPSTFGLGRK